MTESKFPQSAREAARQTANRWLDGAPVSPILMDGEQKMAWMLKEALDEIDRLEAEVNHLQEEGNYREGVIEEMKNDLRCPACHCATPSEAEAAECGCDAPVCSREIALGEAYDMVYRERDRLEAENAELRKHVAERDEALNALAKDSRTLYLSVNSAGIYLVCWEEGGVLLGRGPTPLAAIQDAMAKTKGGGV